MSAPFPPTGMSPADRALVAKLYQFASWAHYNHGLAKPNVVEAWWAKARSAARGLITRGYREPVLAVWRKYRKDEP